MDRIHIKNLNFGKLIILNQKDKKVADFRVMTKGISGLTDPEHLIGITHVYEHMAFQSNKEQTQTELFEYFHKNNIHYNAFTAFERVSFIYKTINKEIINNRFNSLVNNVLNSVLNPLFIQEELESELNVVMNEMLTDELDLENTKKLNKIFGNHHSVFPIGGYVDTIANIKNSDLEEHIIKLFSDGIIFTLTLDFDHYNINNNKLRELINIVEVQLDNCFKIMDTTRRNKLIEGYKNSKYKNLAFTTDYQDEVLKNLKNKINYEDIKIATDKYTPNIMLDSITSPHNIYEFVFMGNEDGDFIKTKLHPEIINRFRIISAIITHHFSSLLNDSLLSQIRNLGLAYHIDISRTDNMFKITVPSMEQEINNVSEPINIDKNIYDLVIKHINILKNLSDNKMIDDEKLENIKQDIKLNEMLHNRIEENCIYNHIIKKLELNHSLAKLNNELGFTYSLFEVDTYAEFYLAPNYKTEFIDLLDTITINDIEEYAKFMLNEQSMITIMFRSILDK